MKSLILLSLLAILPAQGFCDRFWVCYQDNIQKYINEIQLDGGIISDIQTVRVNEMVVSYTIRYRTGEDLRNFFKTN